MNVAEKHDNILVKNYNSGPVGAETIPELIIVTPLREAAKTETLNSGTFLDVLVHILALMRKVNAKIGEHGTE